MDCVNSVEDKIDELVAQNSRKPNLRWIQRGLKEEVSRRNMDYGVDTLYPT